jgi:hypothetical protein
MPQGIDPAQPAIANREETAMIRPTVQVLMIRFSIAPVFALAAAFPCRAAKADLSDRVGRIRTRMDQGAQ